MAQVYLMNYVPDVLDLAWSPSDVWFATCSIDNNVIVWNAEQFPGKQCTRVVNYRRSDSVLDQEIPVLKFINMVQAVHI